MGKFYDELVALTDSNGSVEQYKELWSKHFDDAPTQAHIDQYLRSKKDKHDFNDEYFEEDTYSDTYSG